MNEQKNLYEIFWIQSHCLKSNLTYKLCSQPQLFLGTTHPQTLHCIIYFSSRARKIVEKFIFSSNIFCVISRNGNNFFSAFLIDLWDFFRQNVCESRQWIISSSISRQTHQKIFKMSPNADDTKYLSDDINLVEPMNLIFVDECAEKGEKLEAALGEQNTSAFFYLPAASAKLFKFFAAFFEMRKSNINFILKFQQKKIALLSFLSRFHKFPELASSFGEYFCLLPSQRKQRWK